jgi:hypothetical protein
MKDSNTFKSEMLDLSFQEAFKFVRASNYRRDAVLKSEFFSEEVKKELDNETRDERDFVNFLREITLTSEWFLSGRRPTGPFLLQIIGEENELKVFSSFEKAMDYVRPMLNLDYFRDTWGDEIEFILEDNDYLSDVLSLQAMKESSFRSFPEKPFFVSFESTREIYMFNAPSTFSIEGNEFRREKERDFFLDAKQDNDTLEFTENISGDDDCFVVGVRRVGSNGAKKTLYMVH